MIRFEQLAKDLAGGMKRREAFRRIGGGLAGALLASFGVVKAAPPIYPGYRPPAGLCLGDCNALYPFSEVGSAYGADLVGCMLNCQSCANSGGQTCFTYSYNCEGTDYCYCFGTTEGSGFCGADFYCGYVPACASSRDCPTGWYCTASSCCGLYGYPAQCVPPCSLNPFDFSAPLVAGNRPTAAGK